MKNTELTEMEIAAAAYTEYSRITGGKSLATGQPLPLWCDLPDNIRYAWHGTIYKVVCLVLNQDEIQTTYHDSILAENKKYREALEQIERGVMRYTNLEIRDMVKVALEI